MSENVQISLALSILGFFIVIGPAVLRAMRSDDDNLVLVALALQVVAFFACFVLMLMHLAASLVLQ